MHYKISNKAKDDIEKIWLYTFENWSLTQADYYLELLMNEMEFIANNPMLGKDFSDIRQGYLRAQVKSHFIFYKINKSENIIEVIRVLHQRMDIESRLNEI